MLPDQTSPKEDVASEEMEEGEWIPEVVQDAQGSSDASWDEENWRAQYGQVVQSGNEDLPALSAVDLWDWVVVTETIGRKKRQVSRLVGRPVRRSAKLHPSMPVGGGLLKTAAICAAHLDLVRVASGQIYKLKTPSATYLASLSTYDSSNPTKDWGFPDLFVSFVESHESEISNEGIACGDSRDHDQLPSVKEKFLVSRNLFWLLFFPLAHDLQEVSQNLNWHGAQQLTPHVSLSYLLMILFTYCG